MIQVDMFRSEQPMYNSIYVTAESGHWIACTCMPRGHVIPDYELERSEFAVQEWVASHNNLHVMRAEHAREALPELDYRIEGNDDSDEF